MSVLSGGVLSAIAQCPGCHPFMHFRAWVEFRIKRASSVACDPLRELLEIGLGIVLHREEVVKHIPFRLEFISTFPGPMIKVTLALSDERGLG